MVDITPASPIKQKNVTNDKGDSKNNLYDVGWDPVTNRPIVNGEPLSTSVKTKPPKVQISGTKEQEDRQKMIGNKDNDILDCIPSPRLQRSQSGVQISDLPKPAPKKSSSLRKPNIERRQIKNTYQLGQIQSEHTENLDSRSFDFYSKEKARERVLSLPTLSVSEVAYWMKTLNIKCANKFVEESIDGAILLELTDDILMSPSFGLSRIDGIKLRKFIKEGYVPKP